MNLYYITTLIHSVNSLFQNKLGNDDDDDGGGAFFQGPGVPFFHVGDSRDMQ